MAFQIKIFVCLVVLTILLAGISIFVSIVNQNLYVTPHKGGTFVLIQTEAKEVL